MAEPVSYWQVLGRASRPQYDRCRCVCGKEKDVRRDHRRSGASTSCGCMYEPHNTRHGMTRSRTYLSWCAMKSRCKNPNVTQFAYYGGKGIGFDERWSRFENFVADMGERPAGMTLDRIDGDKNYGPDNCRWADKFTQSRNRKFKGGRKKSYGNHSDA